MIRENDDLYMSHHTLNDNITGIYRFLKDDAGGSRSARRWIHWINDESETFDTQNYSVLMKIDSDIVIGCYYDYDNEEIFYKNAITVSSLSLIHILTEWEKICRQGAEEVTIYLEGKELSIEWVPREAPYA